MSSLTLLADNDINTKMMTHQFKEMADKLVAVGYATDIIEVKYGLTKITTYAVIVDGKEQSVNPYGHEPHSRAQYEALKKAD